MSSRKENICNKTSASKKSARKRVAQPLVGKFTPVNSNSTFANAPPPDLKIRTQLTSTFNQVPSVDYDLQLDIAYSNYLQALVFREYTSNQIKIHMASLNDQLSKYTDILLKKLEVAHELEQSIKERDVHDKIKGLAYNLENKLERNLTELSPEIVFGFNKILETLEYASNHLYLDRVEVLQNQDEYNQLEILLEKCDNILSKILNVSGDITKYQELKDCITRIRSSQKELGMVEKSVKTLQGDINKLSLETVSDVLFENNDVVSRNNIIDV